MSPDGCGETPSEHHYQGDYSICISTISMHVWHAGNQLTNNALLLGSGTLEVSPSACQGWAAQPGGCKSSSSRAGHTPGPFPAGQAELPRSGLSWDQGKHSELPSVPFTQRARAAGERAQLGWGSVTPGTSVPLAVPQSP